MIISSVNGHKGKYWWLYLINGILLMLIGFFFVEAGWIQNMEMVSFLYFSGIYLLGLLDMHVCL